MASFFFMTRRLFLSVKLKCLGIWGSVALKGWRVYIRYWVWDETMLCVVQIIVYLGNSCRWKMPLCSVFSSILGSLGFLKCGSSSHLEVPSKQQFFPSCCWLFYSNSYSTMPRDGMLWIVCLRAVGELMLLLFIVAHEFRRPQMVLICSL